MLDWDAKDLAEKAGVSVTSVFKSEKGSGQIRALIAEKIVRAFNNHGVEFVQNGVSLKDDQITTLAGDGVYIRLLEDVFHSIRRMVNPEALFFFVDNSKSPPEVVATHEMLRKGGIKCRYLCRQNPDRIDFPIEDYRAVPNEYFHNNSSVIYGDKYATMLLDPETGEDRGAIIMKNPHIAAAQRNLFNLIWSKAEKVKR